MYSKSIGIIGGFGAYATLNFFKRILEEFASDNERNYPHIYMDNDFTMPSRTRALLYGEHYDEVVQLIANSLRKMCLLGADYIVLVCGTAHAFLPEACKLVPEAKERIINIIDLLGRKLEESNCTNALIIAAEGTLHKRVYESFLSNKVGLTNPGEDNYAEIRFFIEAVKKNNIGKETFERWIDFLNKFENDTILLGCTEFPVLIDRLRAYDKDGKLDNYQFYDPLELVLNELKHRKVM